MQKDFSHVIASIEMRLKNRANDMIAELMKYTKLDFPFI